MRILDSTRRAPATVLTLLLLSLVSFPLALACAGGDDDSNDDSDAAYDRYVRQVCVAMRRVSDTVLPKVTPSSGPPKDVMAAAWQEFIRDLEAAEPPASLEDYHEEWLEMQREDLDAFRSGNPTYFDPFDHAPEASRELEDRMSDAFQRVQECRFEEPTRVPPPALTSTAPSTPPTPAAAIDYANPEKYLQPGNQSRLTDANATSIKTEVPAAGTRLEQAGAIASWLRSSFRTVPAGGATIGITDVNTLIQTRVLTGCHDSALVLSTVARLFGIPALMADTASIQWAEDFNAGRAAGDTGHVFVEAHVDGRWILIECGSAMYASDYDPSNPVITAPSMPDRKGYYVLAKGLDPAGYGVTSGSVLHQRFVAFAQSLSSLNLRPPAYQWQNLPR